MRRLADRFDDSVGANLRRASRIAILGPNHLEIILPASYDLARKACERPEVQTRIEGALLEITGKTFAVRFRLDSAPPERERERPPNVESRSRRVDEPEDTLVKEVAEKFGIEGWRVQELLQPLITESSTQES
ncbi:MAG: hypothetical protein U0872_02075 [Planctomycetaceae bacterium]